MPDVDIQSEAELLALCARLGAELAPELEVGPPRRDCVAQEQEALRQAIARGDDPLGAALCALRSAKARRRQGATYTPRAIVESMVAWAQRSASPGRIVDPGAGSGRFLLAAAGAFPRAHLIGVELDPVAAAVARANLAAAGLSGRAEVRVCDYRSLELPPIDATTLFIGNPPYVRHHDISPRWKAWLTERARARGLPVRQLAGLHLHFFLATFEHAREGDFGSFISAAEWLDVNYGALARSLLSGPLGAQRIDLIEPAAMPFADAMTTGAIASFRVGAAGTARMRRVRRIRDLGSLSGGRRVSRERLAESQRWSALSRPLRKRPSGLVELGELCRVRRGQVTGANKVWIAGEDTPPLPESVLAPAITRARELFSAGQELRAGGMLRSVVDLSEDLDALDPEERSQVERFLRWARSRGAHQSYIARHRSPWWSVKLGEPAPILATYMARKPPAFVRNRIRARHLNIAHGLYPRNALADPDLDILSRYLARETSVEGGRTYAGGLTKFEPREMERVLVPRPELLAHWSEGEREGRRNDSSAP